MLFLPLLAIYNSWLKNVISREMVISFFIGLCLLFFPLNASASIVSSIYNLLGNEASAKVSDDISYKNSQNMTVLKAVVNNDPKANLNTLELAPISQNALIAEVGPLGTASDIDEVVNTQISIYTVREGDNLSKIAELFDVSVNTIVWANNLNRNEGLKQGQNLVILPISGVRHQVKKGDTVSEIAKKYKADLNEILLYNDISINSKLIPGDIILIPDGELATPVKSKPIKGSLATNNPVHDADGPSYPGYYMRPVIGGTRSQGLHGYNAVDIAAPIGTPIYASAKGKVILSISGGWNGGYGSFIIISHDNGTQTLYAHNSKNIVKLGDTVDKGDLIAKVGQTGHATGPHVHFEIRGAKNPF
jgi:murein DD-endopeptidase MepM/ murein hydrolase activator NlpD